MKTSSEIAGCARDALLPEFLTQARKTVDRELDRLLPAESISPTNIHAAIRWSVFAGGKRFRPALLLAVGETFGATRESLIATACALEMIHTYSLVHDDLPAMDNDDLRRGRPTCHVRFGEATAILAGDALLTLAFKTVSEDDNLSAAKRVLLISEIAKAAGTPDGMIAGQAFDLEAEARNVAADELEKIHRLKTGALITAAARCGAIIADASPVALAAIDGLCGPTWFVVSNHRRSAGCNCNCRNYRQDSGQRCAFEQSNLSRALRNRSHSQTFGRYARGSLRCARSH